MTRDTSGGMFMLLVEELNTSIWRRMESNSPTLNAMWKQITIY